MFHGFVNSWPCACVRVRPSLQQIQNQNIFFNDDVIVLGNGIRSIIETFNSAASQIYSPKQFSEKEMDLATLVLKIGGPRLVDACFQFGIIPSKSLIQKVGLKSL